MYLMDHAMGEPFEKQPDPRMPMEFLVLLAVFACSVLLSIFGNHEFSQALAEGFAGP